MKHKPDSIIVIDYNGGNLASAQRALIAAAHMINLPVNVEISNKPEHVQNADRLILPGQGAFTDCMNGLQSIPGLLESLNAKVRQGTPFLGICVGMQIMAEQGLEHKTTKGLGWIQGKIKPIDTTDLPLPHMGWNELNFKVNAHPVMNGINPGDHAYFVHSYALSAEDNKDIIATTDYGISIPAIIAKKNAIGTQFHVEKSQQVGLHILANFLRWNPTPA